MGKLFMIILIVGLILGGYTCNPSTEKRNEELSIEELEPEYDSMEKEIIEESNQYEKQTDLLQKWEEPEDEIFEEDLSN
jgi:hypothetical protein